ncbi:ricin-type beta-trefoil lectin domain protein [Streptomyces sp. NPDC088124]|uniref:RICIN domain-containing protein n=1 Tax=Streptomyces sp. NPDC088124 TaxID=3154654 RepID=UPI003423D9A6
MGLKGTFTRFAGAGAALAFGSTLLAGAATSAQAAQTAQAPQAANFQVINGNSSNSCLQVVNISAGKGNVTLGKCDRSAKQVWQISGGFFKNPASGHCLDGNGADVYTFKCNKGKYQKWTTTSGSPKQIKHDWSGKYLHGNGKVGSEVVFKPAGQSSRWVIGQV